MPEQPFAEQLRLKMRAGYPLIFVRASEEWRAAREIARVAQGLKFACQGWLATTGWQKITEAPAANGDGTTDLDDALKIIFKAQQKSCWVLVNPQRNWDNGLTIQSLKDMAFHAKGASKTVIVVANTDKIPHELQPEFAVIAFGLPDKALLKERLDFVADSVLPGDLKDGDRATKRQELLASPEDQILESALGLTSTEAENAFALSVVETKRFDARIIAREKAQAVAKTGFLEFYTPPPGGLEIVGGLANLKAWLRQRKGTLANAEARKFGLPEPKGILLLGVPGTGKSLVAKQMANEWGLPLLKFDVGKIFGSLVGQTEQNLRTALETAEATAPNIVFVDEIEKALAGSSSSGGDSGVTMRVGGALMTWLQDRKRPCFLVCTANDIGNLPAPLFRAGRFDEIFWTDLPAQAERQEIISIHLKLRGRTPAEFDVASVASATPGFSGAELESVVVKGLFAAFAAKRELATSDLLAAAQATVPLSVTRREDIAGMRTWAKARAVPASAEAAPDIPGDVGAVVERRQINLN